MSRRNHRKNRLKATRAITMPNETRSEAKSEREVADSTALDLSLNCIMIPVEKLRIPTEYQRRIDWNRVRDIAKKFDISLFSPLDVSLRDDGFYYVMDGQHHFEAGKMKDALLVPCIIHVGLSVADESAFFRKKNSSQRPPSPMAHYHAAIVEGDPVVLQLQRDFDKLGITVSRNRGANKVSAIGEIMKLTDVYGDEIVCAAFMSSVKAWPEHTSNCSTEIIGGLCEFTKRYGDDVEFDRFLARVGGVTLSKLLNQLEEKLIERNITSHGSTPFKRNLMCRFLVETFNKGLRRSADRLTLMEVVNG